MVSAFASSDNRVFQMRVVQRARNVVERGAGGGDEAVEDGPVAGAALGLGAQRLQALVIGGVALAQPLAKHLLQAGEAVEAEMLGKADQRRGLHAGRSGDAGGGAEGDVVGIVERVGGDLGDALGQAFAPIEDRGAQRLEVARYPFVHRRLRPSSFA